MNPVQDEDKILREAGKELTEKAEELFAKGELTRAEFLDLKWRALQMMRPREYATIVGI